MSPKKVFLESQPIAEAHARRMEDPAIRSALLVAFNELCWRLPTAEHPQQSWAANARREGAKEFIEIFLTLGNPPEIRRPTAAGKLENEDGHHTKRTGRASGE